MNSSLHTELWTSWASLLRSYAAAHGLNTHQFAVIEFGEDEIVVRYGSKWVRFTHDGVESSEGITSAFALHEDGTVSIGAETDEMDMAAERITRTLMFS
ncbi:MAG: transcriptional regulator [Acidobacteriota bacterium]|nr:transcriptional regulator [Acidobacteriota bacterium]